MNRKGFSLIELVVVIAIMGVAMSVAGYSLTYIQSTRAKDCAERMNFAIEATRTNAMSRTGLNQVEFYKDSNGIKMKRTVGGVENPVESIGASSIVVKFTYDDGVGRIEHVLSDADTNDTITITFDKSSGSFSGTYPKKITIMGGSKVKTITLYGLTGRTVLE